MTRRNVRRAAVLLPVVGLLAAACGGDAEEGGNAAAGASGSEAPAESCFEGETATFTVPYSPGGGYDTIARGLAPYLEDELGLDAVVVENRPGAGGLIAANELFNAEPDGLTFGLVSTQGLIGSQIAEAEGVNYDVTEFTPVTRLAQDARVLLTGGSSDLQSMDDVLAADSLQWATAGVGANDHVDANVLPVILGIDGKVKVVSGFEGSSETELAVTAGEVELGSGTLGTRLAGIEAGDQRPLLLIGREREESIPDTPALMELDLGDQQDLAEAYIGLQESGRSVLAPPGLPDNCLAELEGAFQTILEDPAFQEEIGGSVDVPFEFGSSEELGKSIESVLDAPPELADLLKSAYSE